MPVLLDVSEDIEHMQFSIPTSIHIPLGNIRQQLHTFDKKTPLITYCAIGVRSYNAARIFRNHGFEDVKIYPGGTNFYKAVTPSHDHHSSATLFAAEHNTESHK